MVLGLPNPASATVDLCDLGQFPGCLQDFDTCQFDLDYGGTGAALSLGALGVEGLGTLLNSDVEAQTDLEIGCTVEGQGTALMTVTTRFTNTGATTSPDLEFFAFVNPDGNAFSGSAFLYDVASVDFPGVGGTNPNAWGIDILSRLDSGTPGNLDYEIFTAGQLANSDYCQSVNGGLFCDLVLALQWFLDPLAPGESVEVTVGFSDAGLSLSRGSLGAARADDVTGLADDPGTVLTLSGRSAEIEYIGTLPGFAGGLMAALLLLAGLRRAARR